MNYSLILEYFLDSDYEVEPSRYMEQDTISVNFEVGEKVVQLLHFCIDEFSELPLFYIKNHCDFGELAHVLTTQEYEDLGFICVNDLDSVSVNYERPELAFKESLQRHIKLLSSLITDPEFNKSELQREFRTNWYANTRKLVNDNPITLYCALDENGFNWLDLYKPVISDSLMSIQSSFAAVSKRNSDSYVERYLNISNREIHKNSVGLFLPVKSINPIIPSNANGLKDWLLETIDNLELDVKAKVERELLPVKAKDFWLVLGTVTPSGKAWVGVKLSSNKKNPFPGNKAKIVDWKIKPFFVETFNKELLLPRSGAITSFDRKKVLLIGCGSVGSEIANKLGAAGVGQLDIADPDSFSTSNLYRHTLSRDYIQWPKAVAVTRQLLEKYPWIKVTPYSSKLLDLRATNAIKQYDLIIIATGSPTHERIFHDYIVKSKISVSTIYCWLEGYGVGGHAILNIPQKKGCLKCAYIESESGMRGLASNLNFLTSNQDIVKNYAGCGEMFIPYGANSSAQTALIATDLAIDFLRGKYVESMKVTWKGDADDALSMGLRLTDRYHHFTDSLVKQPLRHPLCDTCNSHERTLFTSQCGKRLWLPNKIHQELKTYRQVDDDKLESAGLLIGCYKSNGEVLIDRVTKPKTTDQRTRTSFKLDAQAHQTEIDAAYSASDRMLGYVGTWHTHPQLVPTPSIPDKVDWQNHANENNERVLFFVVLGIEKTSVYIIEQDNIVELLEEM